MGHSPGKFRISVFREKHDHVTELTLHSVSLLLLKHKQVSCAIDVPLYCIAEKYKNLRTLPTVYTWDFYLRRIEYCPLLSTRHKTISQPYPGGGFPEVVGARKRSLLNTIQYDSRKVNL